MNFTEKPLHFRKKFPINFAKILLKTYKNYNKIAEKNYNKIITKLQIWPIFENLGTQGRKV